MAEASSRIFISYRREDSSGHVLALLPALRQHFGADRIFKDTDNIPPGADFVKFIRRELETCSVMLAIIGREWLTIQDPRLKRSRLQNPDDFLRVEVSTALKNEHTRVIPVLVERSSMPAAEDLPPDLTELAYRNAVELSDGRWESDVRRLIEAIERANAAAAPAAPVDAPPARPELVDLQKRRAREIAAQVTAAREAFAAGDLEGALWACERALLLDPQQPEAMEILDRARKAADEQKITAWLNEARQLLREGDTGGASDLIDQALAMDNASEAALTLRKEMLALRRERERERERARAVKTALERARSSLEDGDFEGAVRYADDALGLGADASEAQDIKTKAQAVLDERRRQRETKRRAQQAVTDARAKFAAGDEDGAVQLLREFTPPHEIIAQALTLIQKEAETQARRRRVDGSVKRAAAALEAGQFSDALNFLSEVAGIDSGTHDIASLMREVQARHEAAAAAEQARHEAERKLADASVKFDDHEYSAARQLVEEAQRVDPRNPNTAGWLTRIDTAIAEEKAAAERQRIGAAIERARDALTRGDFDAAVEAADDALALNAEHYDARELKTKAEIARNAVATVGRARRLFAEDEHAAALALLENFEPPHPTVLEALNELRKERQSIEQRRREKEEADARLKAEEQRLAAERQRIQTIAGMLASGREAIDRRDHASATKHAQGVLALDEHSTEAQQLLRDASTLRASVELEQEAQRRAEAAAEKARQEAARIAEEKRQAEARERAERERIAREAAEAEQRARAEAATRRRVEELLAEGQAALTAKRYREAKRKARAALQLSPGSAPAETLLQAADSALHEASPELWSSTTVRLAAAAVLTIATATGIWQFSNPSPADPPAEQPPIARNDPSAGTAGAQPGGQRGPDSSAGTSTGSSAPPTSAATSTATPPSGTPPTTASPSGAATPTAEPSSSEPRPTAPEDAAPVPPPVDPNAKKLEEFTSTARLELKKGRRPQALNSAMQGLQLAPGDAELRSLVDGLLRDATRDTERAKGKAAAANAATLAPGTFAQAQEMERAAGRSREAARPDEATRSFWEATRRFQNAEREADEATKAQARRIEDERKKEKSSIDSATAKPDATKGSSASTTSPSPRPPSGTDEKTAPSPAAPDRSTSTGTPTPVPIEIEKARVEETLTRFERAYDRRDVEAARAEYPNAPPERLVWSSQQFEYYRMEIVVGKTDFDPSRTKAVVACRVFHLFKPRIGKEERLERKQEFTLQKSRDAWKITAIRETR